MSKLLKPIMSKDDLFALMAQNDQGRQGINDDLIELSQLPPIIEWSADLPTLCGERMCGCIPTVEYCFRQVCNYARCDRHIDITSKFIELMMPTEEGQFVVAGGSICDILKYRTCGHMRREKRDISDIDMFAVNMTPEVAEAKIIAFYGQFHRGVTLYRTANCITLIYGRDGAEIQIITRLYSSFSQILYGFDIAASAVLLALDTLGRPKLMFTPLAAFTHKSGYFPIDLERRRSSFETRISKYHNDKQFGVIFPHLSPDALENIKFSIHTLKFTSVCKLKDMLFKAKLDFGTHHDDDISGKCKSDNAVYGSLPYHAREDIIMFNVSNLMWNNNYLVSTAVRAGDAFSISNWDTLIDNLEPMYDSFSIGFKRDIDSFDERHDPATSLLNKIIYIKLKQLSSAYHVYKIKQLFNNKGITHKVMQARINCEFGYSSIDEMLKIILECVAEIADTVRERTLTVRPTIGWKASDEGTCNAPAKQSAPLFAMKYIDPATYYGKYYMPEETLTKCATKCD